MQTIYLHIGRGQTGTSTIQRFLAVNRKRLLAEGIHYPRTDGGAAGVGHQDFGKSFVQHPPKAMATLPNPEKVQEAVWREISRTRAGIVLLSSENFEIGDAQKVRRFFESLPASCDVKIIFFARSQDELAESEYNQVVRTRLETRSFREYLEQGYDERPFTGTADFAATIGKWEQEFGKENLVCRVFDGSAMNAIEQFLSCLPEISGGLLPLSARSRSSGYLNSSVGFKTLTTARLLNSVRLPVRARLYRILAKSLEGQDLPCLFFDSEEARAFRSHFAESNRLFTSRYLGSAAADLGGRRFSDHQRDEIREGIKFLKLDSL